MCVAEVGYIHQCINIRGYITTDYHLCALYIPYVEGLINRLCNYTLHIDTLYSKQPNRLTLQVDVHSTFNQFHWRCYCVGSYKGLGNFTAVEYRMIAATTPNVKDKRVISSQLQSVVYIYSSMIYLLSICMRVHTRTVHQMVTAAHKHRDKSKGHPQRSHRLAHHHQDHLPLDNPSEHLGVGL